LTALGPIGLADERDGIHRAVFLVVGVTGRDPQGFADCEKVFEEN
jgi:hypothetical protein